MRVLVCGGRKYSDRAHLFKVLDQIHNDGTNITCIIEGECSGADQLSALWAAKRGVPIDPYPISSEEWAHYGLGAGPIRNARMLRDGKPDRVVAFPGRSGTKDMKDKARKAKVPVTEA